MAQFDKETLAIVKRLQMARLHLLRTQPFYALLLLHMTFSLDLSCGTAYTDGTRIAFNPDFINHLSDSELEFVLIHEVLHVALRHCFRQQSDYDQKAYDIACDIVVNSNILYSFGMDVSAITLKEFGESMHRTPGGDEGYLYSVEEVYEMVYAELQEARQAGGAGGGGDGDSGDDGGDGDGDGKGDDNGDGKDEDEVEVYGGSQGKNGRLSANPCKRFDDHTFWEGENEDKTQGQTWLQRMVDATEIVANMEAISIADPSKTFGGFPLFAQRLLKDLKNGTVDWRTILQDFVQEEINDYSFSPPDRRFADGDFFLPDFNEKEEKIKNIWFLIDTSGSISDAAIQAAYNEIGSAVELYHGKLEAFLSFTESYVTDPIPFSSVEDLMAIKPIGGGGNDFSDIFRYMKKNMMDDLPTYIIIITDGYDAFPREEEAMGIPVLWIINNDDTDPPWGKVARIKVEGNDTLY